jgi:hypothetical protein
MPKPRDPVINVIHYFETAELPLAQQALAMAAAIVKNRLPKKATAGKPSKPRSTRRQEEEPPLPLTN